MKGPGIYIPQSLDKRKLMYEEWLAARDRTIRYFESLGKRLDCFGEADFWIVDDWLVAYLIQVEIRDFSILHPEVIDGARALLAEMPKFGMTIQVCAPDIKRPDWPRMGLSLYDGKISDGLKRDYLPAPYNTVRYSNSRPDDRPDLPFV